MLAHGLYLQEGEERTATLPIPVAPFAYAAAVAMVPVCLQFVQRSLSALLEVTKK
jgi:hypothetical protein